MIDVTAHDRQTIQRILAARVPHAEVRAFGSRYRWTAKEYSDLDLAIVSERPLALEELSHLREDFAESDLPFRVDIVDWHALSPEFQEVIKQGYEVIQASQRTALPRGWQVSTLGAVCNRGGGFIQTGPFGSQLHASDYVAHGIPSIMPNNIKNNHLSIEGMSKITKQDAIRLSRYRVKPGDIVFSRRGEVDQHILVGIEQDGWLCGTGCMQVRLGSSDVDPRYAYYYLSQPSIRDWIIQHAIGATMPNLNTSILSAVPFVLPLPNEQRAIAHILGTLDDKIELNRRMNESLEAIARALFKSWFVDFDPVRAKMQGRQPFGMDAETATLFPDGFEDSELGEIPRGWRVATLGDVARTVRRPANPLAVAPDTPYIGLEHIPRRSIALAQWGFAQGITSNKWFFEQGEILFGKLRPYFHKVGIAPTNGVCSTDILVIVPKQAIWFSYVLMHLSSTSLIDYADRLSNGAKMPRINWSDIANYDVVLAPQDLEEKFNRIVAPMMRLIQRNIHELRTLAMLRDSLLPKLISGEVQVKDE